MTRKHYELIAWAIADGSKYVDPYDIDSPVTDIITNLVKVFQVDNPTRFDTRKFIEACTINHNNSRRPNVLKDRCLTLLGFSENCPD